MGLNLRVDWSRGPTSSALSLTSRVGNFWQKIFCGRRNRRNNWFVPAKFRLFRGIARKLLEFRSEPFRRGEKWSELERGTKISRSKLSEFCYQPFCGRENLLGIPFRGTKIEANSRNSFPTHCLRRKQAVNSVCWSRIFWETIFFHVIP